MLTQDEHREACRVYMQKYRSKPENREKIRQQNAEYRKRKKQESIRQVSEIGSLESTIDMLKNRVQELEDSLHHSEYKIKVYEKEKLIPNSYMESISTLKLQLSNALEENEEKNNIISNLQQQTQSQQLQLHQLQLLLQQQQQAQQPPVSNSTPISTSSTPPPPTLQKQQSFNLDLNKASLSSTSTSPSLPSTPTSNSYISSSILSNKKQKIIQESFSNHSSPPSSPSLHYIPNSPILPSSLMLSPSVSPTPTPNLSTGNLASLVPSDHDSNTSTSSSSTNPSPTYKSNPTFNLELLCDVLQNERALQLSNEQQLQNQQPQAISEKRKSGDFKTSIDFVLNDGK